MLIVQQQHHYILCNTVHTQGEIGEWKRVGTNGHDQDKEGSEKKVSVHKKEWEGKKQYNNGETYHLWWANSGPWVKSGPPTKIFGTSMKKVSLSYFASNRNIFQKSLVVLL